MTEQTDPNACTEYNALSRRSFLSTGLKAGALLGLSMTDLFEAEEAQAAGLQNATAQSAVVIWLGGGASHLDTFDLKPDAPAEIRGQFNPINTKANGMQISEHLPLLAAQADKFSLIRSMTTGEAAHERGTHYMLTGFQPLPGFGVPSFGSVAAKFLPTKSALPPYIAVPGQLQYGGAGFLGAALDPFAPGGDPNNGGFKVRDLDLPQGMTLERMDRRKTLRESVDAAFSRFEKGSDRAKAVNSFYNRAYGLLSSAEARASFDVSKEPAKVRDAYGRTQLGQSLLLARRLVEGGVRFVTVSSGGWDTHNNGFNNLSRNLLPTLDKGVAAFIDDLQQRGLLKTTMVIVMSEFGRTPIINRDGGRDHHARCFSVLVAGGGVKGGVVVGSSDTKGFEPAERPVKPEDLAATIYQCLGIDYTQSITSPEGVRITLSRGGRHIGELV
ncbi:DUF1501 domain-containing protein [Armatimonas sp.]|uniref:DUF1501 domain-containing protein n=1 Tax=Armatimonas sp. TaxID=1872638 RepID=UPI00286CF85E|nr:DUF1501 domain-containing protein [Armatimonas sp.]